MTFAHQPSRVGPAGGYRLPRGKALWRPLATTLFVTIAVFYAANIYDSGLARLIGIAKWSMLLLLIPVAVAAVGRLHVSERLGVEPVTVVLLAGAVGCSLIGSEDLTTSAATLASVILILLASWLVAVPMSDVARRLHFLQIVANVGRLVIVSAVIMWSLGLSLGRGGLRFTAWTDNPNTLGLIITPAIVIMVALLVQKGDWLRCWISLDCLLIGLGGFMLQQTGSRASMVWLAASMLALLTARRGLGANLIIVWIVALIGVAWWDDITGFLQDVLRRGGAVTAANVERDILSGRSEAWPLGIRLFWESPVFGHGIGSSVALIEENFWVFVESRGHHFHNSYLTIAVETGFVGLTAFIVVIGLAFFRGLFAVNAFRSDPSWAVRALPWILFVGALSHGFFETWLLSAGNANALLFWVFVWMIMGGYSRSSTGRDIRWPAYRAPRRRR